MIAPCFGGGVVGRNQVWPHSLPLHTNIHEQLGYALNLNLKLRYTHGKIARCNVNTSQIALDQLFPFTFI